MTSFIEAVLRAKVAQICSHVGYNAITADSTNILVDIYRRSILHLARHCKEAANNNRRVEPTIIDLVQAYDFVGISIPELQEYVLNVKLPFEKEIIRDESKPTNRIQRNLFVDDLLELKKSNDIDEHDENGENKLTVDEFGPEGDDAPSVPLLKDVYLEIANQFPSPSTPTKADKLRIKREEKPAIPRLKITPLDPAVAEPPSFLPLLENLKDDRSIPITIKASQTTPPVEKKRGPKTKAKTKVKNIKVKQKTKVKTKLKKKLKTETSENKAKTTTPPVNILKEPPPQLKTELPSPPRSPAVTNLPPPKPPTPQVESPKNLTPEEPTIKPSTPSVQSGSSLKQKGKKKKKPNNQFAIVTESVTKKAEADEAEWLCPVCNGPDNGDLMLQCEGNCELWFHLKCTGLKKEPKEDENWQCNNCSPPKQIIRPTVICNSTDDLCPECQLPDDGTLMIQCDDPFCAKWFHGKCVNVLSAPEDNDSWFCKVCVDKQQSAFKRRREKRLKH